MRHTLEPDLRNALSNGEFELCYQPLVDLESEHICTCEALLRWNHPTRGKIPPAEFVPVLEASGLMGVVGDWVLRQACAEASSWPANIRVAVNVAVVQFNSSGLVDRIVNALARSGLEAGRLELEITESTFLDDSVGAIAQLQQLHALGIRVALDDFGTGYSSLSYLSDYPFDKIKIDRCFIKALSKGDPTSISIVRAVARLGLSLGMETTAEGVETAEQLEIVRGEGCTSAQGYFFYPPMPAAQVNTLLCGSQGACPQMRSLARVPNVRDLPQRSTTDEEERLRALHQYDIMDTPPEEAFDRITRIAKSIMQAPIAMVSLVDRDRQWFKSRQGIDTTETPRNISFCAHTIQKDEPFVVPDTLKDPRFCSNPLVTGPAQIRAYVGVPLRSSAGHKIGALCINDVKPRQVTQAQLDSLQDLARLVVDELELRKLAAIDFLTGAAAPRTFLFGGKAEFNRARRHHGELACIAFDLDGFKRINDTYGHAAGDQVLAEVVSHCKATLRSTDVIGRIGGEEFGILLPETSAALAVKIAEEIRERTALLVVRHMGHEIRLTASFGVAALTSEDRSFKGILARADKALYEAKSGGRNQVMASSRSVPAKVVNLREFG